LIGVDTDGDYEQRSMISPSMMTLSSRRKQCDATWRAPMNAYILRGEKVESVERVLGAQDRKGLEVKLQS
jgi:hypothetical protein